MSLSIPAPASGQAAPASATITEQSWNTQLERLGGHPLQTWAWGELKARHGWRPERVLFEEPWGSGMAQVLFRRKGPVSIAYVPRGPVLTGDVGRGFRHLTAMMDRVCRRRLAISLIVEPAGPLGLEMAPTGRLAMSRVRPRFQPARTVSVTLRPDDALLAGMHSKHRYNIRLAERRGVTIRAAGTDGDLGIFFALLRDTSERNAFGIHTFDYYADALRLFGDDARLLVAEIDGQVAAAGIAARFGTQGVYLYGASSTTVRADGAAFLLQYHLIRWARDRGATTYDLWGIPATDPEPAARRRDGNDAEPRRGPAGPALLQDPVRWRDRHLPVADGASLRPGPVCGRPARLGLVKWVARRLVGRSHPGR